MANESTLPQPTPSSSPSILTTLLSNARPEDVISYITVSDPVIHADGMNKYTSYRVDCRPPPFDPTPSTNNNDSTIMPDLFLQNNQGQYSSVLRRYSDFLWLYERLHKERAGSIVPPLPEKQAVSRFSPEFVEERRLALERFLRRVILHPEVMDCDAVGIFLRGDDVTFQHAKNVSKSVDKRSAGGEGSVGGGDIMNSSTHLSGAGAFNLTPQKTAGIKKWFSEAKTTLSNDLVSSPDDDLFDEIERYIESLSIQMKRVSNQASGLVRKSKEIANGLFEFGLAFHQLGQSEGEVLGKKLQLVGSTADTLSVLSAQHADAEWKKLEEPFKDYLKMIHAVKLALGRRHDKRVSYTALLHEIQTREVNLHRLRMSPGREGQAYSTEMSIQRYQAAAEVAREDYAECSQRVLREVDRFKREKAEEMKMVVLEFIMLEIELNRSMEKIWGELVPKLEEGSVATDGSGSVEASSSMAASSSAQQATMVNLPPMPASQPTYSNVPAASDPMMESSIQYRDNNIVGMGL
mmetsp:Transcript_14298/g.21441  ORF Transcript_14298/g.21441 Transcript_14298/m.21441 type:complete len:521 (+) Transcript_14298:181-1743(+)